MTVLADNAAGIQTQATTADTGAATVAVTSDSNEITVVLQLGQNVELLTMNGVAPGENLVFALPVPDNSTFKVHLSGTSPDSSSSFQVCVPLPKSNTLTNCTTFPGDGTSTSIALPGSAATTPIDIVATFTSDSGMQYVALTQQTFAADQTYTLPTNWAATTNVPFTATGMPDIITTFDPGVKRVIDGNEMNDSFSEGVDVGVVDGSATDSVDVAAIPGQYQASANVKTGTMTQSFVRTLASVPTSETITGDDLAPWIINVAVGGTPLAMTWDVMDSGGSTQPGGYLMQAQYTTSTATVTWIAMIDSSATSWTLPTLPDSLAAISPSNATGDVTGFPFSMNSSTLTTYLELRTALFGHLGALQSRDTSGFGDIVVSSPNGSF